MGGSADCVGAAAGCVGVGAALCVERVSRTGCQARLNLGSKEKGGRETFCFTILDYKLRPFQDS